MSEFAPEWYTRAPNQRVEAIVLKDVSGWRWAVEAPPTSVSRHLVLRDGECDGADDGMAQVERAMAELGIGGPFEWEERA